MADYQCAKDTYHLESVQLLLDLLSKEGRQAIARRNLTSSIVLSWWPSVVELYARAEADIASCKTPRRAGQASRITIAEVRQGQKIFFSFYVDRVCLFVAEPGSVFLDRRSRSARVGTVVKVRYLRKIEVWGLCIDRSRDRGSLAGVGACQLHVNNLKHL